MNLAEKKLRKYIRNILQESVDNDDINEVRGLSKETDSIYNQLFNPTNFVEDWPPNELPDKTWIDISFFRSEFLKKDILFSIAYVNQKKEKSNKYIKIYPVVHAEAGLNPYFPYRIRIVLDSDVKHLSLDEIKNNTNIKSVIYHELHHLVTNDFHMKQGFKSIQDFKKNSMNTISGLTLNKDKTEEVKISHLLYYLSKNELNSIIGQIAISGEKENNTVYQLFSSYKNMTYEQFQSEMNDYNPNLKINPKLYKKVMDRIAYFFKKADKTFVGYD